MTQVVLQTPRLVLRPIAVDDAAFYLRLVNEPAFLRFIGDKGVRTLDDARKAILDGPVEHFSRLGYGHYMTEIRSDGTAIGICSLIQRETLDDVDIGYAFLPEHGGQGYAFEAASTILAHARHTLGMQRIVAIVSPDNHQSIKLLGKMGLKFERALSLADRDMPADLYASSGV